MVKVFFNNIVKSEFLEQFKNLDTQEVYKRLFKKSARIEERLNIDLFNFDSDTLESFIKNEIAPKTKQSSRTYCNVLSSYIQWGMSKGYSNLDINPLKRSQEYFTTFVENQNSLYLPKSEIEAIIFSLVNAQDSFIVQALFDGIQGTQVSEITSLTRQQVEEAYDNDLIINLKDSKNKCREIKVDVRTLDLAIRANDESEYYKKNGQVDYSDNIKDVISLPYSNYILKPTKTNKHGEDKAVSHYTVYNRLEMIKGLEEFEEYKDTLTSKNIVRSGMLYEAKKILDQNRELDKVAIEEICKKYGIKYKWSLKDFLNKETVREVYAFEYEVN
jgi:hypothetical protein